MTNGPIVSVIVPVYTVSDYIERCVRSIINQTYHDIVTTEIIYYGIDERCIDDIVRCIKSQRKSMMCLNDNNDKIDFDIMKWKVQEAFEQILPEKSHFEK